MFLTAGLAGAYGLSIYAADQAQHRWCSTLSLLTEHSVEQPSNPQANPSREEQYRLYSDFQELKRQFGC